MIAKDIDDVVFFFIEHLFHKWYPTTRHMVSSSSIIDNSPYHLPINCRYCNINTELRHIDTSIIKYRAVIQYQHYTYHGVRQTLI